MLPLISPPQLKQSIERKAYALGVSPEVSCLLAEHLLEILSQYSYDKHTNKQLAQSAS